MITWLQRPMLTPVQGASILDGTLVRGWASPGGAKHVEKLNVRSSLGRAAEPKEIACAAAFMGSDDSSALTGRNMIISCGFYLVHPQELHRL